MPFAAKQQRSKIPVTVSCGGVRSAAFSTSSPVLTRHASPSRLSRASLEPGRWEEEPAARWRYLRADGSLVFFLQTTLLNHLLKERGTKSIAVIENEFGEINIDRELGTSARSVAVAHEARGATSKTFSRPHAQLRTTCSRRRTWCRWRTAASAAP